MRLSRREMILVRAMAMEIRELLLRARQPPHRIPEAVMGERFRKYFHHRFTEAVGMLGQDEGEMLGEVLAELLAKNRFLDGSGYRL